MPREVAIITVPYDSGRKLWRMGAGPAALRGGVASALTRSGHVITETVLAPAELLELEIAGTFELYARLGAELSVVRSRGAFPVVLGGNCGCAIPTAGGPRGDTRGIVWFDAHADYNTPETTSSGFLDGMGLATLTGQCWQALAARIDGFQPLSPQRAALVGARDVSEAERQNLETAGVSWMPPAHEGELASTMHAWILDRGLAEVHVHVDVDVFDPEIVGRANAYAAPNGLSEAEVISVLRVAAEASRITSLSIASYDPLQDRAGGVLAATLSVISEVVRSSLDR